MLDISNVLISEEQIQKRVSELGAQITKDYAGEKLLLLGIMKGSIPFMADLMRRIDLDVTIDLMQVSSYGGETKSSGVVKIIKDLDADITNRHILIVEDIVDTGYTLQYLKSYLSNRGAKSLKIVTMLDKPTRRQVDLKPDYCGFEVPDVFVIGYGLDADQKYRQLPYISYIPQE